MTVKTRITLDTNILIYAIDRDAGDRHRAALEVVRRAALADCVLTLQALAEFFHASTRKSMLAAAEAMKFVDRWAQVFPVAPAGMDSLSRAMGMVAEHQLSFWDSMLWATAAEAGCAAILSENMQDGRTINNVQIINPFAEDAPVRLDSFLR